MKVLIAGGGGREHALAWKIAQSPAVSKLYAAPGNPGIAEIANCIPAGGSPLELLAVARGLDADLTVVGPEAPLVEGVVDLFLSERRLIVGPKKDAARLEGSKVFAKQFFRERAIPTADFIIAASTGEATGALARFDFPVVLKTDGLAGGKGVIVARDPAEAKEALARLPLPLVIEEFLEGEEISFIVLSDGKKFLPFAPSQDHKRAGDGDTGPNTGGMGAFSDDRLLSEQQSHEILERIVGPVIEATRFTGFLYAGLMLTAGGPKVLEFNVRMGDPETQALMLRLESDFAAALLEAARGDLGGQRFRSRPGASACVVLASGGYPGSYHAGIPIRIGDTGGATVFHAGTRMGATGLETAGGRVLGVAAAGPDLPGALERAYAGVAQIHFDGMHYRRDIGARGLARYNRYNRTVSGT